MKISCRGRAATFLSADLSSLGVHLPDKRAMYVYYAKDVNKQTDREAARRQSFRIKRAASANELRRAQKAVVSSAQRREKKVNSVKSRLRSRNFSHRTTKADGPSALNTYISYSIFRLSLHTIHSNEQKNDRLLSCLLDFCCFSLLSVCILAGSFRGPCKEKYQFSNSRSHASLS